MSVNVLGLNTVTSWSRMKPDFSMLSLKHARVEGPYHTAGELHKQLIPSAHLGAVFTPPSAPYYFNPSFALSRSQYPQSVGAHQVFHHPPSPLLPWSVPPRDIPKQAQQPPSTLKRISQSPGLSILKSPKSPLSPRSETITTSELKTSQSSNNERKSDYPCQRGRVPMNGLDKVPMTGNGSSNSEHLKWLSDVTASARANAAAALPLNATQGQVPQEPTSPGRVIQISPSTPGPSGNLLTHTNEGSIFRSPISSVSGGDGLFQTAYPVNSHQAHQQGSGTNLSHYLHQTQQISSHYSPFYTSSYSPNRQYHPTSAGSPDLLPQQFFQVDTFSSKLQSGMEIQQGMVAGPQASSQLPHCRPFVAGQGKRSPPSASISHPSQLSKQPAFLQQSHFTKDSSTFEQASTSKVRRVSVCENLNNGIPRKRESMKQASFEVPNPKHRMLRPANITITEPPLSVIANAPLSAPPLRSMQRSELSSPKQNKLSKPGDFATPSISRQRLSPKTRPYSLSQSAVPGVHSNDLNRDTSTVPNFVPNQGSSETSKGSTQVQYPTYFKKGSIIQLANDSFRRVEDLTTEDFLQSAGLSPDLCIDSSTVVKVSESLVSKTAILGFSVGKKQVQVTVNAPLEHPFFVFNRGWSSCSPEKTLQQYGLVCHKLQVGDLCVSLTHKASEEKAPISDLPPAKSSSLTLSAAPVTKPMLPKRALKTTNIDIPSGNTSLSSNNAALPEPKPSTAASATRKRRSSAPAEIKLEQPPPT